MIVYLLTFVKNIREHKEKLATENPRNVERRHKAEFSSWVHNRVCNISLPMIYYKHI